MRQWFNFFLCCFRRLAGAIFFFLIVVALLTGTIKTLDYFNIAKLSLASFAPYASSLSVFLVIISLALILCIPGGPTALKALFSRVKSFGPIELQPANDPDEENIRSRNAQEVHLTSQPTKPKKLCNSLRLIINRFSPVQKMALHKKLEELRVRKKQILSFHAKRLGIVDVRSGGCTRINDLFFDADMRRGETQILVHLFSDSSTDYREIAKKAKEIVDIAEMAWSASHSLFIHLIFSFPPGRMPQNKDLESVKNIVFNICNIRLFFYSVTDNNSVKPED